MGHKTGRISFNTQDRGRQYRGQKRNFDTTALCQLINSPEVQERVKNRDMIGYYGHTWRANYGMYPPESVMVDGVAVALEPALVTTYLQALPDGTIEHETEFLDTSAGKVAQHTYLSKVGGFSSAMLAQPRRDGVDVPTIFAGFDFVHEPNFSTNRGYLLDGIDNLPHNGNLQRFDSVVQEFNRANQVTAMLLDSAERDLQAALQTIAAMAQENEELLSLLAQKGQMVLDGANSVNRGNSPMSALMVSRSSAAQLLGAAASFKHATLIPMIDAQPDAPQDQLLMDACKHWGIA